MRAGERRAVAELRLGPYQRWSRLGAWPVRLLCHFVTLILITIVVLVHSNDTGLTQREGVYMWDRLLFPRRADDVPNRINSLGMDADLAPFENQPLASYFIRHQRT